MLNMRVFPSVTPEVLNRLARGDDGSYVLDLEPGSCLGGRLTRHTGLGDVVIRFDYNAERSEVTVTILKKPAFLPAIALWAEISNKLENASSEAR
jgi:hypothetical protein